MSKKHDSGKTRTVNTIAKNRGEDAEAQEMDVSDYMDRIADWAEKNAGRLVAGFLAFSVLVVGVWGFNAFKARALNEAANSAGLLNRKIEMLEKAISKAPAEVSAEFSTNKSNEIEKLNASMTELLNTYPSKSVTDFTTVKWASFLIGEKQEDKALEILSKAKPSGSRELSASILMLKASVLANQEKVDEAIKTYDEVLADSGWSLFHAEALIQKGVLQSSKGETDAAMESFGRAKGKAEDSSFSRDASKYWRFLKIQKSQNSASGSEG
jgi:predicted negative regulator of RcsB-dependent stress response